MTFQLRRNKMNLDQVCTIADGVYWEILEKFGVYDEAIHQNVDGSTENTVYGEDLYYTIEEAVKNAVNYKEE
jgi:hypothetical protein